MSCQHGRLGVACSFYCSSFLGSSVTVSVYLSLSLPLAVSVSHCQSVSLSVCLCLYLSVSFYICQSLSVSVCLSVCLFLLWFALVFWFLSLTICAHHSCCCSVTLQIKSWGDFGGWRGGGGGGQAGQIWGDVELTRSLFLSFFHSLCECFETIQTFYTTLWRQV